MHPYVRSGPRDSARALGTIAQRFPTELWDERDSPDHFSAREVLAHLADWEPLFRARMQVAMAQPGATVTVWDETERAVAQNYGLADPVQAAARFLEERNVTLEWVSTLSDEDLQRAYHHPEHGLTSVATTLDLLTAHDAYHLAQLLALQDRHESGNR